MTCHCYFNELGELVKCEDFGVLWMDQQKRLHGADTLATSHIVAAVRRLDAASVKIPSDEEVAEAYHDYCQALQATDQFVVHASQAWKAGVNYGLAQRLPSGPARADVIAAAVQTYPPGCGNHDQRQHAFISGADWRGSWIAPTARPDPFEEHWREHGIAEGASPINIKAYVRAAWDAARDSAS